MKNIYRLIPLLIMGLAVGLLSLSCSSSTTTSSTRSLGDTTSTDYTSARACTEEQLSSMMASFYNGMYFTDGFDPVLGKVLGPADTTYEGYNPNTGWHYYYEEDAYQDCEYYVSDSVRFMNGSSYQQTPDSTTDRMDFKVHAGVDASDSIVAIYEFFNDWVFTGLDGDTVEINGSGGYDWHLSYQEETMDLLIVDTYKDVLIEIDEYYPHSGSLTETMTGSFYSEEGYFNGSYTATYTFYEEYVHIRLQNDDYYWEWDEYYTDLSPGYFGGDKP